MREIILSNGAIARVDDCDFDELSMFRWHHLVSANKEYAYRAQVSAGVQKNILMHRQILRAEASQLVDHKDGDGLNNIRLNIRIATSKQNAKNMRVSGGTSRYKGVSWHTCKGKWRAVIKEDKKAHHIGYFANEVDAASAYDKRARTMFGVDGTYNFPVAEERSAYPKQNIK